MFLFPFVQCFLFQTSSCWHTWKGILTLARVLCPAYLHSDFSSPTNCISSCPTGLCLICEKQFRFQQVKDGISSVCHLRSIKGLLLVYTEAVNSFKYIFFFLDDFSSAVSEDDDISQLCDIRISYCMQFLLSGILKQKHSVFSVHFWVPSLDLSMLLSNHPFNCD